MDVYDLNHVAVYVLPESNIADFVADKVSTNILHSITLSYA
jgi:hypothetical protein